MCGRIKLKIDILALTNVCAMVFKMKQFDIEMSDSVFKVGTDATILGALVELAGTDTVMEIGVGTGVVSLMLAQRFPEVVIHGIDASASAAQLCAKNFAASPFRERLKCYQSALEDFVPDSCFDHIVSNPPYYLGGSKSKKVSNEQAKYQESLPASIIANFAERYLAEDGKLSIIAPLYYFDYMDDQMESLGFSIQCRWQIRNDVQASISRYITTYEREHQQKYITQDFSIYQEHRQFSEQAKDVLSAFLTVL